MRVTKRITVRKLFRQRLVIEMVMLAAWTISGPILKEYYGLLNPAFFSLISIYAMFVHLGQKKLRSKFKVEELFKLTLAMDIVYLICMSSLIIAHDMRSILIFELIYDAPYMTVVFATVHKMENLAFDKWSADRRDKIDSGIDNRRMKLSIISLTIGAALSYVIGVYGVLTIQMLGLTIGIILSIKTIKS